MNIRATKPFLTTHLLSSLYVYICFSTTAMSSPTILSKVKMLQDVVFIEIDGVEPAWDTYCFSLDIESPGPKVH
jgi:hypothetical protein